MAVAANTVWEVRTTGNDTNGGGFVTGAAGTDYSQQDAKNTVGSDISTTDAVANGTTTLTSATANFGTTIVGNIIYLQGGTGGLALTRRQVTARASTTSITLDATVATGTGITMNIGGALASPGEAGRNAVGSNTVWIKAGTYTLASASNNVSTGCLSTPTFIFGYQTTRGDFTSTRPLLQANGVITSFSIITLSSGIVRNIDMDCNSRSTSRGIITSSQCIIADCSVINCTNNGFNGANAMILRCKVSNFSTAAAFVIGTGGGQAWDCVAKDGTQPGFSLSTGGAAHRCIADSCTGANIDGFICNIIGNTISNCVSYNSGRDGFRMVAQSMVINCIADDNVANGFNTVSNPESVLFVNCAAFSNAVDFNIGTGKGAFNISPVTLSASPFTNAGSSDFSLNNTAGAGASCRDAGIPGLSPDGLTTGYLDIGFAQHQATGGGGGAHSAVF